MAFLFGMFLLALIAALAFYVAVTFYAAFVVFPTYYLIDDIVHHQHIHGRGIALEIISIIIIGVTIYLLSRIVMAGQSKVVVNPTKKFWTKVELQPQEF
jgi:hypothetical protein